MKVFEGMSSTRAVFMLYFYNQVIGKKMCEACTLRSRVIVQALRWVVEIATQEK